MNKQIDLQFIWNYRMRLRAEGDKLWAAGDKLWSQGNRLNVTENNKLKAASAQQIAVNAKLRADGAKLWAEDTQIRAEGDRLWAEAVLKCYGNVMIVWIPRKSKKDNACKVEGKTFEP